MDVLILVVLAMANANPMKPAETTRTLSSLKFFLVTPENQNRNQSAKTRPRNARQRNHLAGDAAD